MSFCSEGLTSRVSSYSTSNIFRFLWTRLGSWANQKLLVSEKKKKKRRRRWFPFVSKKMITVKFEIDVVRRKMRGKENIKKTAWTAVWLGQRYGSHAEACLGTLDVNSDHPFFPLGFQIKNGSKEVLKRFQKNKKGSKEAVCSLSHKRCQEVGAQNLFKILG